MSATQEEMVCGHWGGLLPPLESLWVTKGRDGEISSAISADEEVGNGYCDTEALFWENSMWPSKEKALKDLAA